VQKSRDHHYRVSRRPVPRPTRSRLTLQETHIVLVSCMGAITKLPREMKAHSTYNKCKRSPLAKMLNRGEEVIQLWLINTDPDLHSANASCRCNAKRDNKDLHACNDQGTQESLPESHYTWQLQDHRNSEDHITLVGYLPVSLIYRNLSIEES